MEALKTYRPDQVAVILGGFIAGGFADGTFIKVEPDAQDWTKVIGTDGSAARAKTGNKAATITLSLLQTSATNQVLTDFYNADQAGGEGVFPLLVKDNSGNTIYAAEQCWIEKRPSGEFGREVSAREWVLATGELIQTEGGN